MSLTKKTANFLFYWLPPVSWMMFIFLLSSQTKISVTHTFIFDFLIFKTLHILEYAVLYFLFVRAFYPFKKVVLTDNQKLIFPIVISVIYAVVDETHQLFIPTRQGMVRDVLIDTIGIILMYIYIKNNWKLVKEFFMSYEKD